MSSTSPSDNSERNMKNDRMQTGNKDKGIQNKGGNITPPTNYYEDFFENFRQNFQNLMNTMEQAWPSSMLSTMRSMSPFEMFDRLTDTRIPLCDVIDKGDKYEINLEIPGIDKEKVDIKATRNSISISGMQSEKTKEKGKNYIYSERSYKSFHRQIPFAQEILPSQITAKARNGVLEIEIPKRNPTRVEGQDEYKVNIT
jgi:HSP20 family protein